MNNYPSVTQVLSVYQDFSNVPPATLDYATERGIAVHRACAAIALGLWNPRRISSDCKGYIKSFRHWFDDYVAEVLLVEQSLTDETFGYTGTPDLIARMGNLQVAVIDLKTPLAWQPVWSGQMAAYLRLAQVNGYSANKAFTLQLHPDGKMPKATYLDDEANALAAFLGALQGYKYFKGA